MNSDEIEKAKNSMMVEGFMNTKFYELAVNIFLTLVALIIILVPWVAICYTGVNESIAQPFLIASYVVYGLIALNSFLYLGGCIKCHKSIAAGIVAELKATKSIVTYIIPSAVLATAAYASIEKQLYILTIVIVLPMLINKLSNSILVLKSKKAKKEA